MKHFKLGELVTTPKGEGTIIGYEMLLPNGGTKRVYSPRSFASRVIVDVVGEVDELIFWTKDINK